MIIDQFLEYEKDNNLFQLEIDGFRYWHYIRKVIYDDILNKDNKVGQAHTNLSKEYYYKRVLLKLKQIPNWFLFNPLWALKERDLLILNHHRRVKNSERFDCLYTDELLEKFDYSYYVFEQPILEKHIRPIRTKNIRYLDYINFKFAVYHEIKKKVFRFSFNEDTKNKIMHVLADIENFFEVKIDNDKILSILEKKYLYNKYYREAYANILGKVKPKAIIEVVSYGADRFIINEVAKEKGIPVIELQHGTMGKYHIAYNFSKKMELPTFPDYVFIFGQFWNDNTRLPINEDNVKVVGWPYFEKKVNFYKQKNESKQRDRKTILFISQGTIGKELSQMAVTLSNVLDKDFYRIIYKLHPGENSRWKDEYPWLIGTDIEVIDHNFHDMHYYFSRADIQVGVYSTALFEGLAYKCKTIIVKMYGHETMSSLYETGLAFLANCSEELIDFCKGKNDGNKYKIEYYWEKNSMENMIREINKIMKISDGS